ncbi:TetR/AcrR family transcriptional regulator [Desulfosporosinus sp.]|uniref:TetR/AcrR family transcriptional regulator n=1 Tax=Desulfosporosinus sp. TaxID=157907 RepID=UPI000E926F00|nr:TetR/AcrR family transcriptional regulator [Desulfosporosinus sp.]MBC2721734.1 TetR/AcrR family transcriptional regulator [Desulfosporosinus sp.]MBC2726344.1 TetR/AcrR family transcriptional regulator [Desulfosporosinus sp.]HBV85205.1 TetR/AcrR family transcriptional regulator [Desulfosporosinus sp.]
MVSTASREEKQIDILKAAIRVFSEHGFDGAKMEYIAKEAGIGKGTVYEYFESKDRLFEEILKFSVDQFSLGLKESIDKGETIEEKILNCSRFTAKFLSNHMDVMHLAMQVKILSKEIRVHHMAVQEVIFGYYKEMVKVAKENGEFRPDLDEELAMYCITGALEQFCKHRIFMASGPLEEKDHQLIVDVLLRGLK